MGINLSNITTLQSHGLSSELAPAVVDHNQVTNTHITPEPQYDQSDLIGNIVNYKSPDNLGYQVLRLPVTGLRQLEDYLSEFKQLHVPVHSSRKHEGTHVSNSFELVLQRYLIVLTQLGIKNLSLFGLHRNLTSILELGNQPNMRNLNHDYIITTSSLPNDKLVQNIKDNLEKNLNPIRNFEVKFPDGGQTKTVQINSGQTFIDYPPVNLKQRNYQKFHTFDALEVFTLSPGSTINPDIPELDHTIRGVYKNRERNKGEVSSIPLDKL